MSSGRAIAARTPVEAVDAGEREDRELAAAARRDPQAFALLYRRYVDPVYRYCYRRLGSKEAAEDATSQVFTKALAAIPSFRTDAGSFRSWLFTIAHNVVVDSYKGRMSPAPLDAAQEMADGTREHLPDEAALVAADRRAVWGVLARLPPDQRAIVEPRLAGHTGPEIAAILGRSLASVKFAQFRAYGRLREMLGVPAQEQEMRDAQT
ncbi:MAG: RNA polymerase sigma factor [Thermomicrobiales bacterium]